MPELEAQECYAAAALFTLALHATQVESGVGQTGSNDTQSKSTAWGQPAGDDDYQQLQEEVAREGPAPADGAPPALAFWGWDCCGPQGLLERVYSGLGIPACSWQGLKCCPKASGGEPGDQAELWRQVEIYIGVLEPGAQLPVQHSRGSGAGAGAQPATRKRSSQKPESQQLDGDSGWRALREPDGAAADVPLSGLSSQSGEQKDAACSRGGATLGALTEAPLPVAGPSAQVTPPHPSAWSPSMECTSAVQAMWCLLNSCICGIKLQSVEGALPPGDGRDSGGCGGGSPHVCWYDARGRTALKAVSIWLVVPWRSVAAFETLLAHQAAAAELDRAAMAPSAAEAAARWAKVGAASVGAGVLFAITGGLAAPAIAAGLGSAVGLAGGAAGMTGAGAAGASFAGVMGSTAGVFGIGGGIGVAGGNYVGAKTAHRLGDVSEMSFWEIPQSAGPQRSSDTQNVPAVGAAAAEPCHDLKPYVAPLCPRAQPLSSHDRFDNALSPSKYLSNLSAFERGCTHSSGDSSGALVVEEGLTGGVINPDTTTGCTTQRGLQDSAAGAGVGLPVVAGADRKSNALPTMLEFSSGWFGRGGGEGSAIPGGAAQRGETLTRALLPAPFSKQRAENDDLRLSVTICVNGWVRAQEDFMSMWCNVNAVDTEQYALVWETKELVALNHALIDFLASNAAMEVSKLAIQKLLYTGIIAAVAPPMVLASLSTLIDAPWEIALSRATKAGRLLAHMLMQGAHGNRPVTLIGYSMGARLVFHCLLELARHNFRGVVESAVLLGVPVSVRLENWRMVRSVVAGRLVNGFSRRDWILGLVYRSSRGFIKAAAGLMPVDCSGVENVNLSKLVDGHFDYVVQIDEIMQIIDIHAV